ncbi:MAG: 30S ribosomal protein S6, partial [Candidatus Cloacimonadota bacterium]|nr:30S ribosomal protein S6 [Candidatus Cloacimonadota bacterium]
NNYESMIIIDPELSQEVAEKVNEKLISFLKENQAEIIETKFWKKRKLAFEIDKKKEGYYFINNFKFLPENVKKLDRYYKLSDKIFRHNILVKEN